MLTYFLQVNLCWLLFYGLYYVLLSKETFFTLNRIYLIISLLAGLLLPLSADWLRTETPLYIYVPMDSIMLPEFVVGMTEKTVLLPQNREAGNVLTWWKLVVTLYQVGLVVMGMRLLYGLLYIYKTFKTSCIEKENGFLVSNTEGVLAQPFSFFNMIFIAKNQYQDIDYQNIMQHEKAHARQLHSLDVVFLELLKIVFWYSPMVYLYRHSLRNIHEYLADAAVLRSVSKKQYGTLLIQQAQSANVLALVNPFFSQLKKRIVMMTRNPSKRRSLVKYTLAVPVFLLLVSFLASPDNAAMVKTAVLSEGVKNTIENKALNVSENNIENIDNQVISNSEGTAFKVTLAGLESGIITAELAQKQTQFKLIQPNGKSCDVQSCSIYKQLPDGSTTVVLKNTGSTFNPQVRDLMQSLQNGERLFFNAIKVRCPGDVQAQDYGNMGFEIKNDIKLSFLGAIKSDDTSHPSPIMAALSNGHIQGFISVKEMKTHTNMIAIDMDKKTLGRPEIISFTLSRTSTNGQTEKVENQTGQFNADVKRLLNATKLGDVYVFSNIKMKNSGGEIITANNSRFEVNSMDGDVKYNINMSSSPMPPTGVPNKDGFYTIVDEQPQFPQGQKAMFEWLGQNIKYPTKARENGVEGTVYIGFVVGIDGALSNITIKRGISEDCNQEALRVISAMPKWKPGKNQGKEVSVAYTLPIKFKLDGNNVNKTAKVIEEVRFEPKSDDNNEIFTMVDESPEFIADVHIYKWLGQNIRYPKEARDNNAEAIIYVNFIIEKDGSITVSDVKRDKNTLIGQPINEVVVTTFSNANKLTPNKDSIKVIETNGMIGYKIVDNPMVGLLEKEAKRLFSTMPKWKAGRNQGQPVRVAYTLPIKFKLE